MGQRYRWTVNHRNYYPDEVIVEALTPTIARGFENVATIKIVQITGIAEETGGRQHVRTGLTFDALAEKLSMIDATVEQESRRPGWLAICMALLNAAGAAVVGLVYVPGTMWWLGFIAGIVLPLLMGVFFKDIPGIESSKFTIRLFWLLVVVVTGISLVSTVLLLIILVPMRVVIPLR